MPDEISMKRLKKRSLDRWENEGGRISGDRTKAASPPSLGESEEHEHPSRSMTGDDELY